ncbi:MAG TPA: hypothetical protein VGW34_11280 [Allosphingosinicella sp.]|nr:hypothetical protein [Allosphingosinicella sp.]
MALEKIGKFAALSAAAFALAACSSTLKTAELNATGRFDTGASVDPGSLTIAAPYSAQRYGKMAVVLNFTENRTINSFFHDSIANSRKFQNVYSETELERYVIQQQIEGVTDTSSLLSLNKLAQKIGPFLVLKPYVEPKGGYRVTASLEAIDAQTSQTVFKAEKSVTNWAGLDRPLLYPLFNAFIDWTEGRPAPA